MISAKSHGIIKMKEIFEMKKILLILIFAFFHLALFAAPFGLKMGMTIDEISAQCEEKPSFVKDDIYLVKPKKSHPLFEEYAVYVNKTIGLYQIRAFSKPIACNKYGSEIQNSFNNLKDRIAKTYGKPRIINEINQDSMFSGKDYWFYTLKDGSRVLAAAWDEKTLPDNLFAIALDCVAYNGYLEGDAHLILCYYFNNFKSVEDEQDDVF